MWRYERYSLIREYFDRPPLFPPLIFVTHFIEFAKFLYRRLLKHRKKIQAKTFSKSDRDSNEEYRSQFV